jgi:hypothetical protein
MSKLQTIVNANDNLKDRAYYKSTDFKGSKERLLNHIPQARKLIEKYCKKYYKDLQNDDNYIFLENQICMGLDKGAYTPGNRAIKVEFLALMLKVHPLELYNDTEFDF